MKLIRYGNFVEIACDYVGIHVDTYYDWMRRAREGGPRNRPYVDFSEAVKKAEATAEAECVARIRLAGQKGNLRADTWYLERRYPHRWGTRRVEVTGDPVALAAAATAAVDEDASPEELIALYRSLATAPET